MGPMLIFDKSALQAISLDESVWLEQFFLINITPLFYVEVLADLEKQAPEGKTAEEIVGGLAKKTPSGGTFPNIHHHTLVIGDLLGRKVEMTRRPFIKSGEPRVGTDGKVGFYFEESSESKSLRRWSEKKFSEIEKDIAKQWRQALSNLTFETWMEVVKNTVPRDVHFSNIEQIKAFVDKFVTLNDKATLDLALYILDIPTKFHKPILERWEKGSRPALNIFAPYAAYVLSVDMFFYLALNSSFISKDRPSNKIDISYLYYLPFCMLFVSRDKLHKRVAPLFIKDGQSFVDGDELKAGLKELDDYFSAHKKEIDEVGVMTFAHYPPQEKDTYIGRLWDSFGKKWRKDAQEKKSESDLPSDEELLKLFKEQKENSVPMANKGVISSDDADHVTFTRSVPVQKGKWRIMPKGIEDKKE